MLTQAQVAARGHVVQNEGTLRVLDMTSEALITLFLGFGAATLSLLFWKLSRAQSINRL